MVSQWRQITIGDLITLHRGYDLPESDRSVGDIPVVGSFGITGYHNVAKAKGPGVTIGRSGASFGTVFFSKSDFWPHNACLYVTDFHGNDELFVYYFLKTFDFSAYNSGSAQPSLNRNYLYNIPISVPPPDKQREIAQILGSLDDKIDLNRRMNATLESMARALFKSWFVDFDPVRARAEGRQPDGIDADTAALFPDSFQDSTLGPIPYGWRVGTLGEVAMDVRESITPDNLTPDILYIGLDRMPRGTIALSDWGTAEELESNKFAFRAGDFLFGKLRPYFKKVGIAPVDGVCSTDIIVIRPRQDRFSAFVLMWISDDKLIEHVTNLSTGTRMPRTNWKDLAAYPIALPSKEVLVAFQCLVQSLIDHILANVRETKTLAATRDALLPRLMSGELVSLGA